MTLDALGKPTSAEQAPDVPVRVVGAPAGLLSDLRVKAREVLAYREVLINLVRKELKVRYKNSVLGFFWSMLNPLLYLVIFYIVFNIFLPGSIPVFHVYILSGLLPWTFFSSALFQATGSVVASADLVKKVYFPRELLPLSSLGAALVHFVLQFFVLTIFLVATRYPFSGKAALLVLPALGAELLLLAGLGFLFSAVNVKARDIQHALELLLLAWFWMTPIVYPSALVADRLAGRSFAGVPLLTLYLANPVTRVVMAFQRGIYAQITPLLDAQPVQILIDKPLTWYLGGIGYTGIVALVLFALGWWVFHRLDSGFAEEL